MWEDGQKDIKKEVAEFMGRKRCRVGEMGHSISIQHAYVLFLEIIFVDEFRLLPCVYLCIVPTFKYQLFASY